MWTPRRLLLMILGMAGFLATYFLYIQVLGGIDGLPELPERYLQVEDGIADVEIPEQTYSPTLLRLQEAFGPASPEVTDIIEYKTKLELRDKGMVFACGQPMFAPEPSEYVTVSPFSVAFFGKPRPPQLRQPGEVPEITTFHADKAILQFDRPVQNAQDLNGKAQLIGMELTSTPDTPSPDPRRGRIVVTNNQRSSDSGQYLVFRTPGPLFYRAARGKGVATSSDLPQVWSDAAVEIVDRRNLPRPLRSSTWAAVPSRGDDLRARNAVVNILVGQTLPPPTITASGIKIYLAEETSASPQARRNISGYTGVRRVVLNEMVQMNLWTDSGSGLPGTPTTPVQDLPQLREPPLAVGALASAVIDGVAINRLFHEKSLLVIETLGSFHYDFDKNIALFLAKESGNPAVSNHVTVTRLTASGAQDNLFCKRLEVEFRDPKATAADSFRPTAPNQGGMKIRRLTATGEHVFLSVEAEQLLAQGNTLEYTVDDTSRKTVTVLKGMPVVAVRERNRLQGGDAKTSAEVILKSEEKATANRLNRRTDVEIRGPGRMELFDPAANDNTLQASWGDSLIHKKTSVDGKEQDLLTFNGGGTFSDVHGGIRLSADQLQLWLSATETLPEASPTSSKQKAMSLGDSGIGKMLPQRLVALGNVDGQSAEAIIRKTDQLTVHFRDIPPPRNEIAENLSEAPRPSSSDSPATVRPSPPTTTPDQTVPEHGGDKKPGKNKLPIYISARMIDTSVVRYPRSGSNSSGPAATAHDRTSALKYELERARCEDRVMVHQDPADPARSPRGTDIYGTKLLLELAHNGGVLTVHGGDALHPAQVYFEELALFGPVVVIDQPNNAASVDGRGLLKMPSSSDLGGAATSRVSDLEIQWSQRMRFDGALSKAEFIGLVHAIQQPREPPQPLPAAVESLPRPGASVLTSRVAPGTSGPREQTGEDPSWSRSRVLCHRLDVTFDRPIYFNNLRQDQPSRPRENTGNMAATERAQLRTAVCTPVPDDEVAENHPPASRTVIFMQETFQGRNQLLRKAERVTARQLNVENDGREQQIYAAGPGEVRLLQLSSKSPDPNFRSGSPQPPETLDEQEMKLTIVRFPSKMIARDKARLFQEATFPEGARVVQVPSDNLDLQVEEHDLPERSLFLACTQLLEVSSARTRPGVPPRQWMSATGNAEFQTDEYHGFGAKIRYDVDKIVLQGSDSSPAKLFKKQYGRIDRQDYHTGREIIYNRNGTITGSGSVGGSVNTGGN